MKRIIFSILVLLSLAGCSCDDEYEYRMMPIFGGKSIQWVCIPIRKKKPEANCKKEVKEGDGKK